MVELKTFYSADSICPVQTTGALLGRIRHVFGSVGSQKIVYSATAVSKTDFEEFLVDGKQFKLSTLQHGLASAIEEAKRLIDEISPNEAFNSFCDLSAALIDDVDNLKPGYFFLMDNRNQRLAAYCNDLIEAVSTNSSFFQLTDDDVIVAITLRATAFLRKLDEILRILVFLIHCTSGQPARGTEFRTLQFVNTPESPRNIYVNGPAIFTTISHSKTFSRTGQKKFIPRLLPIEVSRLLLFYLSVLRPIQTYGSLLLFNIC